MKQAEAAYEEVLDLRRHLVKANPSQPAVCRPNADNLVMLYHTHWFALTHFAGQV